MKKYWFGLLLLTFGIICSSLRLVNLDKQMTYHLDQGLHLQESLEMVQSKNIRLIGPMVSSRTFEGRGFFIGPQYYYVLALLGIVFNWDPVKITGFLVFFELGFVFWLTLWLRKKHGEIPALVVFGLIALSPFLIVHSRFFWNPHFLLPLGIAAWITLEKFKENSKIWQLFVFGILWGLAIGFHYAAVLWVIPLVYYLWLLRKKIKPLWVGLIFWGVFLGNLPYWVFEMRHGFYNVKTVLWVMTNVKGQPLEPHYLIYPLFWLGLILGIGLIGKIRKKSIKILVVVIIISTILGGQWLMFKDATMPYGHPKNWNFLDMQKSVSLILRDGCPADYNVARTISGDARSYDIRFLLTRAGCKPMAVEAYPNAKTLFLVAPKERRPEKESVWEVSSMGKIKIEYEEKINKEVMLYKLVK